MPDAATALGTSTNGGNDEPSPALLSTNYSCAACQRSFQDGQEQRSHMKESWHVNNVKRRVASLPPIPPEQFDISTVKQDVVAWGNAAPSRKIRQARASSSDEDATDDESEHAASPFQCLFCNQDFVSDDTGLAANVEHMRMAHGLFIPDQEMVVNLQSFIAYLAIEVRSWHECLYCGATKPSTLSIQSHMRDKGHCLLNLDREPELAEFWERPFPLDGAENAGAAGQGRPTTLSATEMRFASGKVIGSRHAASAIKKSSKKQDSAVVALPSSSEQEDSSPLILAPQSAPGQQLSRRQEMGLIGVSEHQRHALVLAEKKAQRSETAARQAREWVSAMGANLQKHDQVDTTGKKGKQNHKLWPR